MVVRDSNICYHVEGLVQLIGIRQRHALDLGSSLEASQNQRFLFAECGDCQYLVYRDPGGLKGWQIMLDEQ